MELRQWDEVKAQEVARQLVDVTCETDLKLVAVRRQGDYAVIDIVFRFPKSLHAHSTIGNFVHNLYFILSTTTTDSQQPLVTTSILRYVGHNNRMFTRRSIALPASYVELYVDDAYQYLLAEYPIDCSAWPKEVAAVNLRVAAKSIFGVCPLQPQDFRIPVTETNK